MTVASQLTPTVPVTAEASSVYQSPERPDLQAAQQFGGTAEQGALSLSDQIEQAERMMQVSAAEGELDKAWGTYYNDAQAHPESPDADLSRFSAAQDGWSKDILDKISNVKAQQIIAARMQARMPELRERAQALANTQRTENTEKQFDAQYDRLSTLDASVMSQADLDRRIAQLKEHVGAGQKAKISGMYIPEVAARAVEVGEANLRKQWAARLKGQEEATRGRFMEEIYQEAMKADDLTEDEDKPIKALDVVNAVPADQLPPEDRNAIMARVKLQHKINVNKADADSEDAQNRMKGEILDGLSKGTMTPETIAAMGQRGINPLPPDQVTAWTNRLVGAEKYRNAATKSSRYNAIETDIHDMLAGRGKVTREKVVDSLVKARFDDGTVNEGDYQRLMSLMVKSYPPAVSAGLSEAASSTLRHSGWVLKSHDRVMRTNAATQAWVDAQLAAKQVPTAQDIYAKSKEFWGLSQGAVAAKAAANEQEQVSLEMGTETPDIQMSPDEQAKAVFGTASANNITIAEAEQLVQKRLQTEAAQKQYERVKRAIDRANADIAQATANVAASPAVTTPTLPQPRRGGRAQPTPTHKPEGTQRIPEHSEPLPTMSPYEQLEDTMRRIAADQTLSPTDKVAARRVLTHQYIDAATREARSTLQSGYDMQSAIADATALKEGPTGSKTWRRWERGTAVLASGGYQLARMLEEVATFDRYGSGAAETSRMYHDVLNQPELQPLVENWFDRYAGAAVESGPFLATSLAPAMLTGGATAPSLIAGFWSTLAVEGNEAYQAALDRGEDEDSARTRGVVVGLINAGIEMGGGSGAKYYKVAAAKNAMSRLGKVGRFTWHETKMALREGLAEEVPQEAVQMVVGGDVPRDADGDVDWEAVATRLTDTAIVGTVMGGTAAAVTSVARAAGNLPEVNRSATPYIQGSAESQYSGVQGGRQTRVAETPEAKAEAPTISAERSGRKTQPSQYQQPPAYDELLERAAGGDEDAVRQLNDIVNREAASMPTYDELLTRAQQGDAEAAAAIQENRFSERGAPRQTFGQAAERATAGLNDEYLPMLDQEGRIEPDSYDELLQKAAGGDEQALNTLRDLTPALPSYDELLERAQAGDADASFAIQNDLYSEAPQERSEAGKQATDFTHLPEETGTELPAGPRTSDDDVAEFKARRKEMFARTGTSTFEPHEVVYEAPVSSPAVPVAETTAKPKAPASKMRYTSVPTDWHAEHDLYDWGKKGLRAKGNRLVAGSKAFPGSKADFTELPTRLPKSTMDAIRAHTDEVWKLHRRRGEDGWLVPARVVEQVKAELGEVAFQRAPKPTRTPKQRLNDIINAGERQRVDDPVIGQALLENLSEMGLTEADLSDRQKKYIEAYRYEQQKTLVPGRSEGGVGEAVRSEGETEHPEAASEEDERAAIQDEDAAGEVGEFFDGIAEASVPAERTWAAVRKWQEDGGVEPLDLTDPEDRRSAILEYLSDNDAEFQQLEDAAQGFGESGNREAENATLDQIDKIVDKIEAEYSPEGLEPGKLTGENLFAKPADEGQPTGFKTDNGLFGQKVVRPTTKGKTPELPDTGTQHIGKEPDRPLIDRRQAGFLDVSWLWKAFSKKRAYEADESERPLWDRIRNALDVANRNRYKVVADISSERSRRYGVAQGLYKQAMAKGVDPTTALNQAIRRSHAGEMASRNEVTPSIRNEIADAMPVIDKRIAEVASRLGLFEGNDLGQAVRYLIDGNYLTRGDVDIIAKYLPQLADAAYGRLTVTERLWDMLLNTVPTVLNIPRTLKTSLLDIGTVGRQGLMFLGSHPLLYGQFYANAWKALVSEGRAAAMRIEIEDHPRYNDAVSHGLALMERGRQTANIGQRGEGYEGAEPLKRIPGVRNVIQASERAYVEPLNVLMLKVYDDTVAAFETRAGQVYDDARAAGSDHETAKALAESTLMSETEKIRLARTVNDLAGRTSLWSKHKAIDTIRSILNAVAFSPRLWASRVKLIPSMVAQAAMAGEHGLLGDVPTFRKQIQGPKMIFMGLAGIAGMTAAVGMLIKLGLAARGEDEDRCKFDVNPESGTFGKIVLDGVAFDFSAGMAQQIRFAWRMATGYRTASDGERIQIDRVREFLNMLRSKEAPTPGVIHDYLRGYNFQGEPFGLQDEVLEALKPLLAQDAMDAFNAHGLPMAIGAGLASFHGVGVQSSVPAASEVERVLKNDLARRVYGPYWNDLSQKQQERLEKRFPEIAQAGIAATRERLGKKANAIRDSFPEDIRAVLDDAAVSVDVSRTIAGGFKLNEERFAEYQKRAAREIELRVRRAMKTGGFNGKNKRRIIQSAVDAGRAQARDELIQDIDRGRL